MANNEVHVLMTLMASPDPVSHLGNLNGVHLYLNHYPDVSLGQTVPELIQANGNHWRKILSIYAKMLFQEGAWQMYRDEQLLHEHAVIFDDRLQNVSNRLIWVPGLGNAKRLGLDVSMSKPILQDESWNDKVRWVDGVLVTPYLDYRQFPNRLVEALRVWLNENDFYAAETPKLK